MKNLYSFIIASIFLVLACGSDDSDSNSSKEDSKPEWSKNLKQENGIWTLTVTTDVSYGESNKDYTWRYVCGDVYDALMANPGISYLNLKMIDVCEDEKGNKNKYQQIIPCDASEIKELRSYKDHMKFVNYCDLWRFKSAKWYRCGWDGLQQFQHSENEIH